MFNVSEPFKSAPQEFKTSLQKTTYAVLVELGITFERVDTDEAITMNDCKIIEEKLKMKMVKTLFYVIVNRQFFTFLSQLEINHLVLKILVQHLVLRELHLRRKNFLKKSLKPKLGRLRFLVYLQTVKMKYRWFLIMIF